MVIKKISYITFLSILIKKYIKTNSWYDKILITKLSRRKSCVFILKKTEEDMKNETTKNEFVFNFFFQNRKTH